MSLMSASYPGYYNTPSTNVPWRGVTTTGRVVSRPTSVGRDGVIPGGMPGRVSNVQAPTYVEPGMAAHFVPSSPSPDAQAFRHLNAGVSNLTLGNSKLAGEDHHLHHEKHYEKDTEENYNSSSAMAIPGAEESDWKKGSSGNHNSNNLSNPASPSSPSKRSSLDIEKEINAQNLYKTELCRSFVETGMCRYGSKCQFAHGQNELRPVLRHPKYKTDFCKTFHTIGTCPYGTRCRFIHKRSEFEAAHSLFMPNSPIPDWSIWKDGNTPEGKQYAQGEEKKPRSISLKERRKTTDVQQLQKLDKSKAQRANIGRQRSNTDSPPPPVRRKNPNGLKKGPTPAAPLKHEHIPSEKSHGRRKSTGNSWSDGMPTGAETSRLHDSLVEHDVNIAGQHQPIHSPPSQIPHHLVGHLNGGMVSPGHSSQRHAPAAVPIPRGMPMVRNEIAFPPEEAYLPPEVLSDDPDESVVEAPKGEKQRRRSNSSASRLPIFQELCTASEEEIAIGATASTVVNRVLSSSS